MKFKKSAIALTAAGLVSMVGPAWAGTSGPPYDVYVNGSSATATYPVRATSTNTHFQVLAFGVFPVDMYCTNVEFTGDATDGVHAGTGVSGTGVATLNHSTWSGCTYGSSPVTVTPNHTVPWSLNATGGATSATTDNVAGNVSGVKVAVSVSSPSCNFSVTGKANGTFDEANQQVHISETSGNLTLTVPAGGCSLFATGDPAKFWGDFDVKTYANQTDFNNNVPMTGTPINLV